MCVSVCVRERELHTQCVCVWVCVSCVCVSVCVCVCECVHVECVVRVILCVFKAVGWGCAGQQTHFQLADCFLKQHSVAASYKCTQLQAELAVPSTAMMILHDIATSHWLCHPCELASCRICCTSWLAIRVGPSTVKRIEHQHKLQTCWYSLPLTAVWPSHGIWRHSVV